MEIQRTQATPSAADYTPQDAVGFEGTGRFSEARPKTDLELLALRYKYEPGPAEYGSEGEYRLEPPCHSIGNPLYFSAFPRMISGT